MTNSETMRCELWQTFIVLKTTFLLNSNMVTDQKKSFFFMGDYQNIWAKFSKNIILNYANNFKL